MSIDKEEVQPSYWADVGKEGQNNLLEGVWKEEGLNPLQNDSTVTSRDSFRSLLSRGGFRRTSPRLAPKGKAATIGGKPRTLKAFLKALGHDDELPKLEAQKIFTVDDLRSVIKGRSEAVALQELRACGLSVKAASDVYKGLDLEAEFLKLMEKAGKKKSKDAFDLPQTLKATRMGGKALDLKIHQEVFQLKQLLTKQGVLAQHSRTLVLSSVNGAGKTFASLSFPSTMQKSIPSLKGLKYLPACYVGFNNKLGLTNPELVHLINAKDTEQAVQRVVMLRSALTLARMVANWKFLYPMKAKKCSPVVVKDLLLKVLPLGDSLDLQLLDQQFTDQCTKLQAKLGKTQDTFVLPLIVDELQYFQKYDKDGARFALRHLRKLQLDIFSASGSKLLLLPFATGINPAVHLANKTEGRNIELDNRVILSKNEFHQLVETRAAKEKPKIKFWKKFAAAAYPRPRSLDTWSLESQPFEDVLKKPKAWDLVKAHLSGKPLPKTSIPIGVWATPVSSGKQARVTLDLVVWDVILEQLGLEMPSVFDDLDFKSSVGKMHTIANSYRFEEGCLHLFDLLFRLFYSPTTPPGVRKAMLKLNPFIGRWAPRGFTPTVDPESYEPETHKLCNHPFDQVAGGKKKQKDVWRNGSLSDEFKDFLENIEKGSGVHIFHCGGNAPLDFLIFFVKPRKRAKLVSGDAKHSQKYGKKLSSSADDLIFKAKEQHKALMREMKKVGWKLAPSTNIFEISNVELTPPKVVGKNRSKNDPNFYPLQLGKDLKFEPFEDLVLSNELKIGKK